MLEIVRCRPETERAQNESAEAVDGFGDLPATHTAATRGLPPQRARLAHYLAWRKSVGDELAALQKGRDKLLNQIAKADRTKGEVAEAADAGAATVLDKIKRGLDWSLGSIVSPALKDHAATVAASEPQIAVAKAALAKLHAEIEAKTRLQDTIAGRHAEFTNAALCEHAKAELGREYQAAIDTVRDCMTRLEALERMTGGGHDGRLVAELPGFRAAGQRHDVLPIVALPSDISAALAAWQALGRAWAKNPRAEPSKHLKFASHDPNAADATPYEARTALERRVIDIENVA